MHLIKTPLGQSAFKERSVLLSARQRALFILVDGQHTVEKILSDTSALHSCIGDVEDMLQKGFLAQAAPKQPGTAANPAAVPGPAAAPPPQAGPPPSLAPTSASEPAFTAPLAGPLTPPPLTSQPLVRPSSQADTPFAQARFQAGKPLATALAARLGLRGFLLNLSVESAASYEDLLLLLPKLQAALGAEACQELERALKG
jgi:hypothetical protein